MQRIAYLALIYAICSPRDPSRTVRSFRLLGVVAGVVYAARAKLASVASTVYPQGMTLLRKTGTAPTRLLPVFAFGGT